MAQKIQPVQAKRRGRKPRLTAEHTVALRAIVRKHPHSSLDEITQELLRRTGTKANPVTVRKALRAAGIERLKPLRRTGERTTAQGAAVRYGCAAQHRRPDNPNGMNTDVTDEEWALVSDLFTRKERRGVPEKYSRRALFNACSYVLRSGCAWRSLPKTFPPWPVVHKTFSRWAACGLLEAMHTKLHELWRDHEGKAAPSIAIIDAQSTRGSAQGGDNGFDAGKKVKGRKRHLVVDGMGLVLAVTVTAASVQDRDAAAQVVAQAHAKAPTIERLYADSAYAGKCAAQIEKEHGIVVEIVRHPGNRTTGTWHDTQEQTEQETPKPEGKRAGFVLQAKRWVVERTHAWNERSRRLTVHHDRSNWAPVAWVWLAQARILAARLAL